LKIPRLLSNDFKNLKPFQCVKVLTDWRKFAANPLASISKWHRLTPDWTSVQLRQQRHASQTQFDPVALGLNLKN
jgi:hypothetical protein